MGFESAQNTVPADESSSESKNPEEMAEIKTKIAEARKSAEHWRAEGDVKNAEWNEERIVKFEEEIEYLKAIDRGDVFLGS